MPGTSGRFALNLGDGGKLRGTYVLISPPHRMAFTWGLQGDPVLPEGCSTVEIYLTADGEETTADLTYRDLPVGERQRHKQGWARQLGKLNETAHRS
jgi:uncharacterized protein YndB with AHSA1/START domain